MNNKDRGILYGMLYGDGNLYKAKNNFGTEYVKLTIGHSPRQRDYLEHKIDLIHSIFGGKRPKIYEYTSFNKTAGKSYRNLQTVKTNKYFRQMLKVLYPGGRKTYTAQGLGYLTDEGLALWYQDDGSLYLHRNKAGNISSASLSIATYCSESEFHILQKWFEEVYGVSPKASIDKRNNKYSLRFLSADSNKLLSIVKPYIHESMLYKVGITQEPRAPSSTEGDDIVQG